MLIHSYKMFITALTLTLTQFLMMSFYLHFPISNFIPTQNIYYWNNSNDD